jgi:zinc resistance-associated protein
MWKAIVVGTAALAIAGTSFVYAQQREGRDYGQRWRPSAEDVRAFGEARLAALKAGLTLTPDQEKNWPSFEQAARDFGKFRMDRRAAVQNTQPTTDPVERLRQRATAMADAGAEMKKLADATDPLYKSLDDGQKRRFAVLSHLSGHGRDHMRGRDGWRDRDGGGWRGRDRDGNGGWGPRHTDAAPMAPEHSGEQHL